MMMMKHLKAAQEAKSMLCSQTQVNPASEGTRGMSRTSIPLWLEPELHIQSYTSSPPICGNELSGYSD